MRRVPTNFLWTSEQSSEPSLAAAPVRARFRAPPRLACFTGWASLLGAVIGAVAPGAALVSAARVRADAPAVSRSNGASRVDGLAAILGGADPLDPTRPILQSDVELRARLLLLGRSSEHALFGELPRSLLRATLNELIGEHLIAVEAERVQIATPTRDDVLRELGELEREAGGHRTVMRLLAWVDASALELEAIAARRALIGAFLRANLEGVSVVTDADVDARLREDAAGNAADAAGAAYAADHRYVGETPEIARASVRASLAKETLTRHIEHWVRVLRARTRVRIFAVYDTP